MKNNQADVAKHDYFNIFALSIMCSANIQFLVLTTDLSKLGTDEIGKGNEQLFQINLFLFMIYVIIDMIWVMFIPTSVLADPNSILVHHAVALIMTFVPLQHQQFSWHFAACTIVECNTLFLTIRRNLPKPSIAYVVSEVLFYTTWLVLRLLLFPLLVVFYTTEYLRFSSQIGTHWNIVLISPVLQFVVTSMSFKWTIDMIRKQFRSKLNSK